LIIVSQIVLAMQLGFAVWPLMRFTGEKAKMGEFVNSVWVKILGWSTTMLIIILSAKYLFDELMPESVLKAVYGFLHLPVPTA
jgi:manganese transport protein